MSEILFRGWLGLYFMSFVIFFIECPTDILTLLFFTPCLDLLAMYNQLM